jgi:hypothetical protein
MFEAGKGDTSDVRSRTLANATRMHQEFERGTEIFRQERNTVWPTTSYARRVKATQPGHGTGIFPLVVK